MEDEDQKDQFGNGGAGDFAGSSSAPKKKKKKKKSSSRSSGSTSGDDSTSRNSASKAALNELEEDVLNKSRASRPPGAVTAPSPGAVPAAASRSAASAGDVAGLNSLESDALAKARAGRTRGPPAAGVGAVSSSGGRQFGKQSGRTARDSAAARTSAQAVVSGAVPATGGAKQGKAPGRTSSTTSADQRASLSALEDDVVAKTRGSRVGARKVWSADPAARKQSRETTSATAVAAAAATTTVAAAAPSQQEPQALSNMRNLESEVLNKQNATVGNPHGSTMEQADEFQDEPEPLPAPVAAQPQAAAVEEGDGFGDALVYQQQERSASPPPRPIVPVVAPATSTVATAESTEPSQAEPVQSEAAVPRQADPVVASEEPREQQPQTTGETYPGVAFGSQDVDAENIEAFVADQVVDATGVAVVMSEEEEERMERKKYRRYMIYGLVCFTLLAAAIVIPIVILVPDSGEADPMVPTTTPSEAPTDFPTFAPTTKEFDDFLELVLPYSGQEALEDKSSPQYQAAIWAANEDELELPIESDQLLQRYFLACFYFATSGDENWELCNRPDPTCGGDPSVKAWLTGTYSECEWLGIQCDDATNTKVETIFFRRSAGAGLSGTLPLELSFMTDLAFLSVGNNDIQGTIPTFLGDMTQLTRLWIQGNSLTGTIPGDVFAKLSNLIYFNCGRNQLVGTIPVELGQISTLLNCEVDRNQLTGKIPPFPYTIELDVFINQLTGQIPNGVWDNVAMKRFYANNNLLTGTISPNVGNMVSLEFLRIGNNDIGGTLPEELFTLPQLDELNLTNCILTGTIPDTISGLNGTVEEIFLDGNKFFGAIPAGFDILAPNLKQLTLHENDLSGSISETVCENRGDSIFNISILTADCSDEDEKVFCDCCTECF
eukprot:CAMPEP_0194045344 /NCGR_PEP_ID=MMETSP0009_2-20130614/16703_1 /TAXON_ID=210454 /ORGANISM="Grammatophora oceanica, Strain CCMP 410" /LENGTH=892 /DNA_ID=CAMNT_0038690183 /DNA_START=186 /DNA_END=2864 /DNA_ORIENTATION=+